MAQAGTSAPPAEEDQNGSHRAVATAQPLPSKGPPLSFRDTVGIPEVRNTCSPFTTLSSSELTGCPAQGMFSDAGFPSAYTGHPPPPAGPLQLPDHSHPGALKELCGQGLLSLTG